MPKLSYGEESKRRTRQLLAALLDYANDALPESRALEGVRSHLSSHWQCDRQLIVRTRLRHLETLCQLTDTPLSQAQIKAALKHLETFLSILEDHRTHRRGSDIWHFSLSLWHNRWEQEANLQALETAWLQQRGMPAQRGAPLPDPWQPYCRQALHGRTELTTNSLTHQTGVAFRLNDLYLPLELMPYAVGPRQELTETAPITPQQFFSQMPPQGRAAILGPPGAGKTTLLQRLAAWILDQTNDLAIWVDLADLGEQSLESYLLQDWLRRALRQLVVPPAMINALGEQFAQGRVWLLLDGVDEMALPASVVLARLARQLTGWVSQARVVLTCRTPVWETGNNALTDFTPYVSLGIPSGEKIQTFIQHWFQAQPQQGERLYRALQRPDRKRIRDAVKNPLRLALLCRLWGFTQGRLPATQALLYQQFQTALYDWNQDVLATTTAQRQQINRLLSRLARQALTESSLRFRHSWVCGTLMPDQLAQFDLALQLGWLQPVGRTQDTGEPVYAFCHQTFQSYFAAQAVTDWRDFLQLTPALSADASAIYPLFEPQWREVILFWLGRPDVATTDKTALLDALISFRDDCGGFFEKRAYLLAAEGLAEFPDYPQRQALIETLIQWRFQPGPLQEPARLALLQTDRPLAIAALEAFVQSSEQTLFNRWLAAHSLGKIYDPGNEVAIATLTQLLQIIRQPFLRLDVAKSLGLVDPGNALALQTLTASLQTAAKPKLQRKAALRLAAIDPGNPLAVATLETLLETASDPVSQRAIRQTLSQTSPEHAGLATVPASPPRRLPHPQHIEATIRRLEQAAHLADRLRLASKLGRDVPGHPLAVEALVACLQQSDQKATLKRATDCLRATASSEQLNIVLPRVKQIYQESPPHADKTQICYKLLWTWADELGYGRFRARWRK